MPEHTHLAVALSLRGTIFASADKFEEADAAYRQADLVVKEPTEVNSVIKTELLTLRSELLCKLGKYEDAASLSRQALGRVEEIFGSNHPRALRINCCTYRNCSPRAAI